MDKLAKKKKRESLWIYIDWSNFQPTNERHAINSTKGLPLYCDID
jgi:hypothetical protein